jgi:hypothetical protein
MSLESITEVVQNAADTIVNEAVEATKETEKVVEGKEESKDEKKTEGPDPERVKNALQILDVLEDPDKSKTFIKALSTQFEEKVQDLPKQDQKDVAKQLIEELKAEVGEGNEYLLQPMLKIFTKLVNERDEKILTNFKELEVKMERQRISNQYEDFMEKNEVSEEEQELIIKLGQDYPPAPGVPLTKYLTQMRKLAKSEMGNQEKPEKTTSKKAETIRNNADRDVFNKNSVGNHKEAPVIKTPMDAVLAAMQTLQEK